MLYAPISLESTSTVTVVDKLFVSVIVTVQTPSSEPESTVKVAEPPVAVAVVDASVATNAYAEALALGLGLGLGEADGDGEVAAHVIAPVNELLAESVTVIGADDGLFASKTSAAGDATGPGLGDGDGLAATVVTE